MRYDRQGRESLGRIQTQMQGLLDGVDRGGRKAFTSAERERWSKLLADHDQLETQIARNEMDGVNASGGRLAGNGRPQIDEFNLAGSDRDLDAIRADMRGPHNGRRSPCARTPEDRAFSNYLRHGLDGLNAEDREIMAGRFTGDTNNLVGFRNAQSTSTTAAGGALVPQGFSDLLMEAMKWFGGIDGTVGEFTTESGNPWPWPTVNDTTNAGRVIGQNVQVVETDLTLSNVTFNSYILSSDLVLVPRTLMEDSYFDMDALVARLLGIRLGRRLNHEATVGNGTGTLTGIVNAAVTAGLINTFGSGKTSTFDYGDLINLEHAVDPVYRGPNSRWMFPDAVLKAMKKLVDGNSRPLWQPGLTASFADGAAVVGAGRPTVLGYPYEINQDMATPTANAYTFLFGDMSTYKLRKVGTPTVLRLVERYADYLQVGFIGFFRCDGNLIDAGTHPLVVGQQSAS